MDNLPSNETISYFLTKAMEHHINHIMTDWKTVNPKAIKILEENTMNIKNILHRLDMKIIPSCIRKDDKCMYNSIFAAIQNSMTRTLNADITLEMEQSLIDNPISFLLRLIVGI